MRETALADAYRAVRLHAVIWRVRARAPVVAAALADVHADRFTPEERHWIERIEALRARLSESEEAVEAVDYPDLGAEKDYERPYMKAQTLGEAMRSASQPPRCRFIFKLVSRLAPSHLLELGTHVGLGAAYMAAALSLRGSGRLVTLEGSPALADIARRNLVELGLATRVDVRTGLFTATLPHALKEGGYDIVYVDGHHDRDATIRYHEQILPHVRSIALYDDVTYSDGMREAWAHIQNDSRFAVSLTCPPLGVGCLGSRRNLHVHSWLPIQAI